MERNDFVEPILSTLFVMGLAFGLAWILARMFPAGRNEGPAHAEPSPDLSHDDR